MGGPGPAAAQPCYWGVYIQGTQFVPNQVFCLHGDPQFAFHSLLIQGQRVAQGTGTELGGRGRGWGGWAVPRLPLEGATLLAQHWLGTLRVPSGGLGSRVTVEMVPLLPASPGCFPLPQRAPQVNWLLPQGLRTSHSCGLCCISLRCPGLNTPSPPPGGPPWYPVCSSLARGPVLPHSPQTVLPEPLSAQAAAQQTGPRLLLCPGQPVTPGVLLSPPSQGWWGRAGPEALVS